MRYFQPFAPIWRLKLAFLLAAIASVTCVTGCKSDQSAAAPPAKPDAKAGVKPPAEPVEHSIAQVKGVRPIEISLISSKFAVEVEIVNPNPARLRLHNTHYTITIEGVDAIIGDIPSQEAIEPSATKIITIPLSISYSELLSAAPKVKQGSLVTCQANMRLHFRSGSAPPFSIPLKAEGQLPIPARVGAELLDVRWTTLKWEEAAGTARVQFTNANPYEVRLQKLSFTLWLAGGVVHRANLDLDVPLSKDGKHMIEFPIMFSPRGLGLVNVHALEGKKCNSNIEGGFIMDSRFGTIELPFNHQADAPMIKP